MNGKIHRRDAETQKRFSSSPLRLCGDSSFIPHPSFFILLFPRQAGPDALRQGLLRGRHLGQMAAGQPGQEAGLAHRIDKMDRPRLAHEPGEGRGE